MEDNSVKLKFQKEFLVTHNEMRKNHSTPDNPTPELKQSNELNKSAQEWADHLLSIGNLEHSSTDDGENVYFASSSAKITLTGKEAVDSWYGEIKDYNWDKPGFGANTGYFTQVVWKESTEVGVGMATDGKKAFVVGQYRPAGNKIKKGNFEENVLPKADGKSGTASSDGNGKNKKDCTLL